MKTVKIFIETENAAFHPDPGREVARILRKMASDIEVGKKTAVRDINGNTVGSVEIEADVDGYAN